MFKTVKQVCLLVALGLLLAGTAQASSSFYKGKTLTIVVPYGPGGGYDTWARLVGPYMKKYLDLKRVLVKNQPGGGGLIGTNAIYDAGSNGLTIGDTNAAGDVFAQLAGAPGLHADVTKLNWIGRPDDDPHIIAVHKDSPYKNLGDLMALKGSGKTVDALATGKGSSDYNSAVITYNVFDIPFHMVAAFSGSHAEKATFVAGGGDTISVSASDIAELGKNKARVIVLTAGEPFSKLPNVPTVIQEANKHNLSQTKKDVLHTMTDVMEMGHAFIAPPGVPEQRVKALRTAFEKTLHNKDFLQKAQKAGLYSGYQSGEKLADTASEALDHKQELEPFLQTH